MSAKPFHLGWFLQGSSIQAWGERWTGNIASSWMVPEMFVDACAPGYPDRIAGLQHRPQA